MSRPSAEVPSPVSAERLDADALVACLPPDIAGRIDRLDVFASVDSTNRHLLETPPPSPGAVNVALADHQHAGRGRRGRSWTAPPGAGLCLSVSFPLQRSPRQLLALPLAAGVAARRAIAQVCGIEVGLKWPNDLAWVDRKLGGILVERAPPSAGAHVVIGVGINVAVPAGMLPTLSDWPAGAVDLSGAAGGRPPARVPLAAALIAELAVLSVRFEQAGFAAYRDEFVAADALLGRPVRIVGERSSTSGVARGVDADGALIVEAPDGSLERVLAGDVSIRADRDGGRVSP